MIAMFENKGPYENDVTFLLEEGEVFWFGQDRPYHIHGEFNHYTVPIGPKELTWWSE